MQQEVYLLHYKSLKMKHLVLVASLIAVILVWKNTDKKGVENRIANPGITCTDTQCSGSYTGAEFVNGEDIAHQFSNEMSGVVGAKLKELYTQGDYKKVDFLNIVMSTKGMGTGKVEYKLTIPFESVAEKCEAYTSFDHVGGWNHSPSLEKRKKELQAVLMPGHTLDISSLKSTPEGLQEHWIQWKNKNVQSDCK